MKRKRNGSYKELSSVIWMTASLQDKSPVIRYYFGTGCVLRAMRPSPPELQSSGGTSRTKQTQGSAWGGRQSGSEEARGRQPGP